MPDDTTTPDATGDAGSEDWATRYKGLQAASFKREQAAEELRVKHDATLAELATYKAKEAAAIEEATAEAEYERLRERFEPESPMPLRHNEPREPKERPPEDISKLGGWPT